MGRVSQCANVRDPVMNLNLGGYLKPFRGGRDDFPTFWSKFLVVGKINKWDDGSSSKIDYLPLLLEGETSLVFQQMSETDRKDADKVKEKLELSFKPTSSQAYKLFGMRVHRSDESVDAYIADLQRLLALSGHKEATEGKDPVLM